MNDQAQGLRELMARDGSQSDSRLVAGQTTPLICHDVPKSELDKAKLWDDLERWKSVGGFDKPALEPSPVAEFWEIMQRREEQAR